VDLVAPVILEVASDNNLNVGDWVNSGTTFTLDFSEDVKIGSAYDPWSLMSVFANVDDVNIVWTDGGAGNPDLLDDAPIASSISGGNILLNFTSDTNALGNWTEGFDAFNILSNPVGNFFEDVSGNDILKYPSDWEIIWP
jgi:hypothetical protein